MCVEWATAIYIITSYHLQLLHHIIVFVRQVRQLREQVALLQEQVALLQRGGAAAALTAREPPPLSTGVDAPHGRLAALLAEGEGAVCGTLKARSRRVRNNRPSAVISSYLILSKQ